MEGYWKLRFDIVDDTDYKTFLETLCADSDRAVFYYHPDGKTDGKCPHIHGLLYNYKYIDDTLRKNVKRNFNLTSSTSCSVSNTFKRGTKMTELLYPRYITYMSKGKYEPVSSKGFSKEETDLAKFLWVEPKEEKLQNIIIVPREKVKPKLTQYNCTKEAYTRYLIDTQDDSDNPDWMAIGEKCIEVLHENGKMAPQVLVCNMLQDIESDINRTAFLRKVLNRAGLS